MSTTARIVRHPGRQQPFTLWIDNHVWSFHETKDDAEDSLISELRRRVANSDANNAMKLAFAKAKKGK